MTTQQDRPSARPRTKSMLSFSSHKSSGSGGKPAKMDLVETSKEKAHRRMTSKNDPTMAMRELQPGQAALEKNTIDSIRGIQHKDIHGNLITDPDKSNPTRPRLERPLDTIRSFEAAIDGGYTKRYSTRPESREGGVMQSRRSSYHQGYSNGGPPRFPADGAYGPGANAAGRMGPPRPDIYNDNYNRASPTPLRDNRRMSSRNYSDNALYGNNANAGPQSGHGYNQSYDAATTTSGSGNSYGTEPWGNSTDPSSENSSVDRIPQPPPKADLAEQYGLSGFGGGPEFQGPIIEEVGHGAPSYGQPGYGRQGQGSNPPDYYPVQNGQNGYQHQESDMPPPPPPHKQNGVSGNRLQSTRKPLNDSASSNRTDSAEKRKSWLKRRFSKNG